MSKIWGLPLIWLGNSGFWSNQVLWSWSQVEILGLRLKVSFTLKKDSSSLTKLDGRSQIGSRWGCGWFLRWCFGSLCHCQRSWGCRCWWCGLGSKWGHRANGCLKSESPGRKPATNLISTALPLSTLIQTSSSHWFKLQ